jgi:hypothetical protein
MTSSLPGLLLRILRVNPGLGEHREMTYIVIRPPYAYLEEELRRPFEDQKGVAIMVDKRYGERRLRRQPLVADRRHAARRRLKDELLEVVIVNGAP